MSDNVPYQDDVTRGELRHAMRGYNALGYPPAGYVPAGNGMVTIIIMAPPATAIPDWRTGAFPSQPSMPRQAWPAFDWRMWVQMLCVVAIIGGVGYLAWGMFAPPSQQQWAWPGVAAATGGMRLDPATGHMAAPTAAEQAQAALDDALALLRGLLPPAQQQPPAQEESGWSWLPKNPVGDAIDGTMQIVQWLVYAVIALAVLWLISFIVGVAGKFRR